MKILINDQYHEIENNKNLKEVIALIEYSNKKFAVAINQVFIPKSQYTEKLIKDGDVIDIIIPVQGG